LEYALSQQLTATSINKHDNKPHRGEYSDIYSLVNIINSWTYSSPW